MSANDNKGSPPISYSVAGAAKAIGMSNRSIWRRIAAGEIKTFKLGVRTLIRADALQAFIDSHSKAA